MEMLLNQHFVLQKYISSLFNLLVKLCFSLLNRFILELKIPGVSMNFGPGCSFLILFLAVKPNCLSVQNLNDTRWGGNYLREAINRGTVIIQGNTVL